MAALNLTNPASLLESQNSKQTKSSSGPGVSVDEFKNMIKALGAMDLQEQDLLVAAYEPFSFAALTAEEDEELTPESGNNETKYKPGDVIMEESPFVSVVMTECAATRCHQCYSPESSENKLRRCCRCRFARYCNDNCSKKAWKVHKMECSLLATYTPETGLVPDALIRLVNLVLMKVKSGQTTVPDDACRPKTERDFSVLCSHTAEIDSQLDTSDKFSKNMEEIKKFMGPKTLLAIGEETIAETYSKVMTNSITIQDRLGNQLGIGLYFAISQFDHSCLPNAIYFARTGAPKLSIIAIRPIRAISDVRISYIDPMKPTTQRRAELKESYYFTCSCASCHGIQRDGITRSIKCPKNTCSGFLLLGKDGKPLGPCSLCEGRVGNRDILLEQSRDLMATIEQFVRQNPTPSSDLQVLHVLLSLQKEASEKLFKLNYYRSRLSTLSVVYHDVICREPQKALPVIMDLIDAYTFYLGPVSMSACGDMTNAAQMLVGMGEWKRAAKMAIRAMELVKVIYGAEDKYFEDLGRLVNICLERLHSPDSVGPI